MGRGEDLQNFQSYTVHALGCNGLGAKRKSGSKNFLSNVTFDLEPLSVEGVRGLVVQIHAFRISLGKRSENLKWGLCTW